MATKKATKKFPFIKSFDDYHEIGFKQDSLRELFEDNSIKGKELGFVEFSSGPYTGLFYQGKKPAVTEIVSLLRKHFAKDIKSGCMTEELLKAVAIGKSIYFDEETKTYYAD